MKNCFIIIFAILGLLSCNKSVDVEPQVVLDLDSVAIYNNTPSQEITLTSTHSWKIEISESADWFNLSPKSGTGGQYILTVSIIPDKLPDQDAALKLTIISEYVSKEVTVNFTAKNLRYMH